MRYCAGKRPSTRERGTKLASAPSGLYDSCRVAGGSSRIGVLRALAGAGMPSGVVAGALAVENGCDILMFSNHRAEEA